MTTHWNGTLNEEAPLLPSHLSTTPGLRRSSAPRRRAELLFTMEANEVFLAFLETPPDFSHCGINE